MPSTKPAERVEDRSSSPQTDHNPLLMDRIRKRIAREADEAEDPKSSVHVSHSAHYNQAD